MTPLPPCSGERFFGFLFVNGVMDRLNRRIFSYFSVFFSIFSFGGRLLDSVGRVGYVGN